MQDSSLGPCCEIALRWMPEYVINEKSTLVQVMAWCHQATSHYLSQCWPRSVSPYGVSRPQWYSVIYRIITHCCVSKEFLRIVFAICSIWYICVGYNEPLWEMSFWEYVNYQYARLLPTINKFGMNHLRNQAHVSTFMETWSNPGLG